MTYRYSILVEKYKSYGFLLIYVIVCFLTLTLPFRLISSAALIPRSFSNIFGILFSPFIHVDINHLLGNLAIILPVYVASQILYPKQNLRHFVYQYLLTGLITWLIASPGVHIGGSSVAISMCFYILLTGIMKMEFQNLLISLLVLALNLFVYLDFWREYPGVSHEGHIVGALVGITISITGHFWKW